MVNFVLRTSKIIYLHKAIDRINLKYNMRKLPLDKSNLNLNVWLSGMRDGEGNFFWSSGGVYSINRKKGIYYINQRIIYKEKLCNDQFFFNVI